jgi:hypothetical protein
VENAYRIHVLSFSPIESRYQTFVPGGIHPGHLARKRVNSSQRSASQRRLNLQQYSEISSLKLNHGTSKASPLEEKKQKFYLDLEQQLGCWYSKFKTDGDAILEDRDTASSLVEFVQIRG